MELMDSFCRGRSADSGIQGVQTSVVRASDLGVRTSATWSRGERLLVEGRECRIGNPGSGWGGALLALTVRVSGTLVLHSPKVPHPDFSVKVIGHNLKILWLWKTLMGKSVGGTLPLSLC